MSQRRRWVAVAGLLAAGALLSPTAVPLYDGVGFPDEPYRYVPPRSSDDFVASAARVELRVVDGVNAGGLLANSNELGPQVSVYAPPKAFQVAGAPKASEIRLRADPVVLSPPAPPVGGCCRAAGGGCAGQPDRRAPVRRRRLPRRALPLRAAAQQR